MALPSPAQPFVWGAGGSVKTPEQVAREREIAAALMQEGMDYSPVGHWLAGAARAAQAGVGALKGRWADEAQQKGIAGFEARPGFQQIFGGGAAPIQTASVDPVASALMGAPQTASDATAALVSVPSGDTAGYVRNGLIQRGLPEHVADAFLLNFQDESGFDPGVNEAAPTVPGSRGGYGLYQLTGPRRVAYEQYAQQLGVDPSNVDAQLDFLMSELQGPEAAAAQAILSAPDTGSAAAAIVNKFLRPAEEHRARRAAQYTGGAGASQQVAQALMGGGNATGGASPSMQDLIGLASDPWANDAQKAIVQSLLGQQMQQQDPAYQLDMQLKQAQLAAANAPPAPAPLKYEVIDGQVVAIDPNSNSASAIGSFGQPTTPPRPMTPEERAMWGIPESDTTPYAIVDGLPKPISGGGQTINVGGNNDIGTIPAGMMVTRDAAGNVTGMQAIPGSPAEREAQAAADAAQAGTNQTSRYGNVVVEDIDRALSVLANDPTWSTGILGQAMGNFRGSSSDRLNNLLDTVRANSAFDRLQAMRDASPTGGALGAVSVRELGLLMSAIGSI